MNASQFPFCSACIPFKITTDKRSHDIGYLCQPVFPVISLLHWCHPFPKTEVTSSVPEVHLSWMICIVDNSSKEVICICCMAKPDASLLTLHLPLVAVVDSGNTLHNEFAIVWTQTCGQQFRGETVQYILFVYKPCRYWILFRLSDTFFFCHG
jgi:hypothetical protein